MLRTKTAVLHTQDFEYGCGNSHPLSVELEFKGCFLRISNAAIRDTTSGIP